MTNDLTVTAVLLFETNVRQQATTARGERNERFRYNVRRVNEWKSFDSREIQSWAATGTNSIMTSRISKGSRTMNSAFLGVMRLVLSHG